MANQLEIVQKYFFRKKNGKIDYEHPYDLIEKTTYKGWYFVRVDKHVGYMNEDGEVTIPISYDSSRINYLDEEQAYCSNWLYYDDNTVITDAFKEDKVGVINSNGEEVVPFEFEKVELCLASKNFIPIALPSSDNSRLLWGMYDVKNKRISVKPQYHEIKKEYNGYSSYKEDDKWGLVHCATGTVVIPAIYSTELQLLDNGLVMAFMPNELEYETMSFIGVKECHVLVVNGIEPAQVVISGYYWVEISKPFVICNRECIEKDGPAIVKCHIGHPDFAQQLDSFRILKMPSYIAIVQNASYEVGHYLANGEFQRGRDRCHWIDYTYREIIPADDISKASFRAKTYDGKEIEVTEEMKQEILKRIQEENHKFSG